MMNSMNKMNPHQRVRNVISNLNRSEWKYIQSYLSMSGPDVSPNSWRIIILLNLERRRIGLWLSRSVVLVTLLTDLFAVVDSGVASTGVLFTIFSSAEPCASNGWTALIGFVLLVIVYCCCPLAVASDPGMTSRWIRLGLMLPSGRSCLITRSIKGLKREPLNLMGRVVMRNTTPKIKVTMDFSNVKIRASPEANATIADIKKAKNTNRIKWIHDGDWSRWYFLISHLEYRLHRDFENRRDEWWPWSRLVHHQLKGHKQGYLEGPSEQSIEGPEERHPWWS